MGQRVELNTRAPDFALSDYLGQMVRLSDFLGSKNVVLVFNRGFF
jgi:peroxiredoxin